MSVYTKVSQSELATFMTDYAVGELINHQGIESGIENTNFFVYTQSQQQKSEYVLTLFEQHNAEDLPYFIHLMQHLADAGIPTARPIPDKKGVLLKQLNGRPTVLVARLQGKEPKTIDANICQQIGKAIAQMHKAVQSYRGGTRAHSRDFDWQQKTANILLPILNKEDAFLLEDELVWQQQQQQYYKNLPLGVIHADVFRDNTLFMEGKLTGIIDFYYACNYVFLYDLAVIANDWCRLENGDFDEDRLKAFCHAYQSIRPLNSDELQCWANMVRFSALRFWLSRLKSEMNPPEGELTHLKDPEEFKIKLIASRRENLTPSCFL